MNANGDCYEAAGKYMMDNCMMGGCSLILVHGEVQGQGHLGGVTYGHAWVLDGGTVIDVSNGTVFKGYAFQGLPMYRSLPANPRRTYPWH